MSDYVASVNRAIDHIVHHLDEPLSLETVARVAHFSPFHFHRIFKTLTGETLAAFVKRLRLERALFLLSHDRPKPLTQIALACGFASSSDFSRSFKQRYGVPPSAFDLATFRASRRADLEACVPDDRNLLKRLPPGENPDGFVASLVELPPRTVAYSRVFDPFKPNRVTDAAANLVAWAERQAVADSTWLGYMWDDPEITALADCRYDVGVVLPPDTVVEHDVDRFEFPAMTVAQVELRGPIDLEQRAIDWIFGSWLPTSGWVPTEHPMFESWFGRPFAHGMTHFELALQLPVQRA